MDSVDSVIAVAVVSALICGFVCSAIASSKGLGPGGYFFVGVLLGLIGIVIAIVAQPARQPVAYRSAPAPVVPAGWYADPLAIAQMRYYDGSQWTEHTHTSAPVR